MNEELRKILAEAFTEYRRAYRSEETTETILPPRDKYPDIVSYQAARVIEAFEIKKREPNSPKPQETK